MLFCDFEVFAHNWLAVILDMDRQERVVIADDVERLRAFHEEHRRDIWVGYNIKHYDQYILKAILLGLDPKKVSDWIIVKDRQGWQYTRRFNDIPLVIYDVMNSLDRGLKFFEGSMGNSIEESSVPFDIDRRLTPDELAEVVKYCTHDVEQTVEVFLARKDDFEAQMGLIRMFDLPLSDLSKTKVQLSAKILEANRRSYDDELDIDFPDTLRLAPEHAFIPDWYRHMSTLTLDYVREHWIDEFGGKDTERSRAKIPTNSEELKRFVYSQSLKVDIAGVPHVFGWGGVHGARENYVGEGYFINMDVASLYPSLMIQYNLHSRSCNPQKFNDIVETRLKYKAERNPLQAPLKIVINGTYGAMKADNPLYDPRQANRVCLYGQMLLLDLIEKLAPHADIIQSNTDGVMVRMPDGREEDEWFHLIDDIAYEWERRTRLKLEFSEFRKVFQKDVNNYVIVDGDGKYKSKGAYVKKLGRLDYDLPIVNRALVDYMVRGVPVERTIMGCDELKEFQMVKKISGLYSCILHGGERLDVRCVRLFASRDMQDGGVSKIHSKTGREAKMEGTPEHCFIVNGSMEGLEVPDRLDRQWYIKTALDRLKGFVFKQ